MADHVRLWRRRGTSYGLRARRQMALIGLAGIVLELVIVQTALSGLKRVDVAYEGEDRIARAQHYFQDADQAHDALHADVLQALWESHQGVQLPADPHGGLALDAADFRANLAKVGTVALSPALTSALHDIAPVEVRYVTAAEALVDLAKQDPVAASRQLPTFTQVFVQLEQGQRDVTAKLAAEGSVVHGQADRDQRAARWRITAAALAALVGLLGLTWLLNRLGRALAEMAARERGVAETLQTSLLPDELPDLPGVRLGARYVPGGAGAQVGGDWYDVIALRSGAVGLVMGDVAGHDLRAASVMGQLRNALRAYAAEGFAPGEVLDRLNRLAMTQAPDEMATCVYAVLDPVAATLEVANAGHYAPMIVEPDGTVRSVDQAASPPIGAVRETRYAGVLHQLTPGSTLVMFTDGLVERRGVSVENGLALLAELLARPVESLDMLLDDLIDGLLGDEAPKDDVALLVVRPSAGLGDHLELTWPADPVCLVELRRTMERWLAEAGADPAEVYEIVVACSEAATNAIEHAYGPGDAQFEVVCDIDPGERVVTVAVRDWGHWRNARGSDRGRGLQLIEGLMDGVDVTRSDTGTEVSMHRSLAGHLPVQVSDPSRERLPA